LKFIEAELRLRYLRQRSPAFSRKGTCTLKLNQTGKTLNTFVWARIRVTRSGEFSPIGQSFPLSSLLKITKVAQI
jgi:hypothetical protein